MLVTIIIPVYRAESYIERCIDSVLAQTYNNIEIILVDDGSPDRSGYICDYYADRYNNIRVIHQDNHGVSSARNQGIRASQGDYIQFVDSDDYLDKNCTKRLVEAVINSKADMVISGFYDTNSESMKMVLPELAAGIYSREEISKHILKDPYSLIYGVLWNKLYRKRLLGGICFDTRMDFGEDFSFNLQYLRKCRKISILNQALYNYVRYNTNSLMYRQTKHMSGYRDYIKRIDKRIMIYKNYKSYFVDNGLYETYKNSVELYLLRMYVSELWDMRFAKMSTKDVNYCRSYIQSKCNMNKVSRDMGRRLYARMYTRFSLAKIKNYIGKRLMRS